MAEMGALVDFLADKIVRSFLVRLPARSVCRFRAVSRAWRRLLTDRDFLYEHHRHQPLVPMAAFIHCKYCPGDVVYTRLGVQSLDFRTGEIQAVMKGTPVARDRFSFEDNKVFKVHGSCNGLLLIHFHKDFFICNPATRKKVRLPRLQLQSDEVAAFYCYDYGGPLEDYRVLYHRGDGPDKCYYIISLRNLENIRCIGRPSFSTSASLDAALVKGPSSAWERPPLQLHGSLHWPPQDQEHHILVFDTVTEASSWMSSPVVVQERDTVVLLEMDARLAMSTCRKGSLVVELWILQDNKIWDRAHKIQLPQELIHNFDYQDGGFAFVGSKDGDVLVSSPRSILQYNINGRRVRDFAPEGFPHYLTTHLYKETLVPYYID